MARKLLTIFSNSNISGISSNDDIDVFVDESKDDINKLYYESQKIYSYYLFIDCEVEFSEKSELFITNILMHYKPSVLVLNSKFNIYHRSLIHYIYPTLSQSLYGDIVYKIINISIYPFREYIYNATKNKVIRNYGDKKMIDNIIYNNEIKLNQIVKKYIISKRGKSKNSNLVLEWFSHSCKMNMLSYIYNNIVVNTDDIGDINYIKTVNIHRYFNVEHPYFKYRLIKLNKNNMEMYGDVSTYNFAHDFGNGRRNNIINHLIYVNNYKTYLEIGVYNCYHFNDILIENKWGVDPSPKVNDKIYKKWSSRIYHMTSSKFWLSKSDIKYDIIFIDGCLLEDNIVNDIEQALKNITENGIIVVHDVNPPHEFYQRDNYNNRYIKNKDNNIIWNGKKYTDRHWNGKTWKAFAKLRYTRDDLEIYVVDTDWGVGLIRRGKQKLFNYVREEELLKYETLLKYRRYLLNLITIEEFLDIYGIHKQNNT